MIRRGSLITAFVVGLVVNVAARADMAPLSAVDIEGRQSVCVRSEVEAQPTNSASLFDYPSVVGMDLGTVQFVPEASEDLKATSEKQTQRPQILTDGQSSLSLCLSALVGLGVCSSAHCLKKLHFGFIPEWYHHGGPSQIGHSLVVDPGSVCPVSAYCFVQPAAMAEDRIPQYRLGIIVSLWRQSQFTLAVIASRGPPSMS